MEVLHPALRVQLGKVPHEFVTLDARVRLVEPARDLADRETRDQPRLHVAHDAADRTAPRDADVHAVAQETPDVVGGDGREAEAFVPLVGDDDRSRDVEPLGDLPAQLEVAASWRPDLDVDDALLAGALQVARDR